MANGLDFQYRELSTGAFRDKASGRFIPNPIGIVAIATGPQMQAMLRAEAEKIAGVARSLALAEAHNTGDYMRGIRAGSGIEKSGGKPVAAGRVNAFDWKSHWIEFGTSLGFAARHILERAAEACGHQVSAGVNARRIFGSGRERLRAVK